MAEVEEIIRDATGEKRFAGWVLTRVWLVTLDVIDDGHIAAVEAVIEDVDIGADIGDAHPSNEMVFLRVLTPQATDSRLVWRVIGSYLQSTGFSPSNSPLDELPTISWSSNTYTIAATQDNAEDAVVNSAGQAFDPPLTSERHTLLATIGYNTEDYDPADAIEFIGSVNGEDTVVGNLTVKKRMAKIVQLDAEQLRFNGVEYFSVTVKVEILFEEWVDGQGWDRRVLDQGIYGLDNDDLVRLRTDDGQEATEPLLLDGEGKRLASTSDDPVFLTFKIAKEKDFSTLELEVQLAEPPFVGLA